jgi:BrnA antitoxin of type II toxin-antitoxin system
LRGNSGGNCYACKSDTIMLSRGSGDSWLVPGANLYQRKKLVRRGRPAGSAKKTQTTVRITNEVLAFFRASGRGWHTRMDEALKKYVAARQR